MVTGAEDTRQLILRTAETLFLRYGYNAVSMNQLVEEVSKVRKLSKPAVYYHFEDKEALFTAVVRALIERHGREIAAAAAVEGDLHTRVYALATAIERGNPREFPRLMRDFAHALSDAGRAELEQTFQRAIMQPLVATFTQAAASGELRPEISPPLAARMFFHLVGSLHFGPPMEHSAQDNAKTVTDLLLNGIAAR